MEVSLQSSMLLWIPIWIFLDFYGYPCIDLVWILDPGLIRHYTIPQFQVLSFSNSLKVALLRVKWRLK